MYLYYVEISKSVFEVFDLNVPWAILKKYAEISKSVDSVYKVYENFREFQKIFKFNDSLELQKFRLLAVQLKEVICGSTNGSDIYIYIYIYLIL